MDFTFVNQNEAAAIASRRAAHRRLRKNGRRINIPLDVSLLESGYYAPTRHDPPPQLGPSILQTLDDRVIQRFVARWAARQTALGCLDSMPELLEASGEGSAMQRAILATAYADLAVYERHGGRETKCYQAYSGSLRRLRDELSRPNFVASDGILAAVLAVDAFELLYMGRTDPLGVHTQAMIHLLELRKECDLEAGQNFALWRSAHQRIYVRQLFCEIPLFTSFDISDPAFGDEKQPEIHTIKFVADACQILTKLDQGRIRLGELAGIAEMTRLCDRLRALVQEAHAWSEQSALVPKSRRVTFDVEADLELVRIFPRATAIIFDDFWLARDRVLFSICNIKILDMLMDFRTQAFSSHHAGVVDVETARQFLLESEPELAAMQSHCRFVVDSVPLLIGLIDSNGNAKLDPWILNDTGVLSVRSPLNAIGRLKYVSPSLRSEARGVFSFLDDHRHILRQFE